MKVAYGIIKVVLMMRKEEYEQIFQNDASLSITVGILVGMFKTVINNFLTLQSRVS